MAQLVLLFVGLLLLILGAEFLVRGASTIARAFRVPPLAIGLTVVAFGTSTPELTVSIVSALQDSSDIAIGNVVGSNVFNVLLILGVCAVIYPLHVTIDLIRRDGPVMIGVSVLALLMTTDRFVTRVEGAILLVGLVVYTIWTLRSSVRGESTGESIPRDRWPTCTDSPGRLVTSFFLVVVSLVGLVIGSRQFVAGAVWLARMVGVSDLVIGLTIVAAGTSLPEVATSIVATVRGERDIAVGNVVGSNIFNILGVLGITAVASPSPGVAVSAQSALLDLPVMVVVAIACIPVFISGREISRWEGVLFLVFYGAYTAVLLLLSSSGRPSVVPFNNPLLYFALLSIPLLVVTVIGSVLSRTTVKD